MLKRIGRKRSKKKELRKEIGLIENIGWRVGKSIRVESKGWEKYEGEIEIEVVNIEGGKIKKNGNGILKRNVEEKEYEWNEKKVKGISISEIEEIIESKEREEKRRNIVEIDIIRKVEEEIRIGKKILGKEEIEGIEGIEMLIEKSLKEKKEMEEGSVKKWNEEKVELIEMIEEDEKGGKEKEKIMKRNEGRIGF